MDVRRRDSTVSSDGFAESVRAFLRVPTGRGHGYDETMGVIERGEGGGDLLGTGVPGNLSFTCASETIENAQVAVIDEAILDTHRELKVNTYLFLWRGRRWISATDFVLERLRGPDARAIREFITVLSG
jgi:hypothetical protein